MMVRQSERDIVVRNSGAKWNVSWVIHYYMCTVVLRNSTSGNYHTTNKYEIPTYHVSIVYSVRQDDFRPSETYSCYYCYFDSIRRIVLRLPAVSIDGVVVTCCFFGGCEWSNSATTGTTVIEVVVLQVAVLAVFCSEILEFGYFSLVRIYVESLVRIYVEICRWSTTNKTT